MNRACCGRLGLANPRRTCCSARVCLYQVEFRYSLTKVKVDCDVAHGEKHMRGVILAGGLGIRLHPLTKVTNKALLPVYDRPMIYWPIQSLVKSGVTDILLVCGGNAAGEFLRILGNGKAFGLERLHYLYQAEAKGIADALGLCKEWAGGENVAVILADNIFEKPFGNFVEEFEANPVGARIFLTEVDRPQYYGVVETTEDGSVKNIEEKPSQPKSNLIATGLYMYDHHVWDYIQRCKPSGRGELEITSVNNFYLEAGRLKAHKIDGWWADAGESIDAFLDANIKAKEIVNAYSSKEA